MSFQRLVFSTTGAPEEVLRIESADDPAPQDHECDLEVLAAPINPSDINFIQGVYGLKPQLPETPGFEGVARLRRASNAWAAGTLVMPVKSFRTWQERALASPSGCIALPEGIDPLQAAMLAVNPMTALRLIRDFATLQPGDWIVQNAANSGVGISVIQLARSFGFRTLNVVRRDSCRESLLAAGGDAVVLEGEDLAAQLKDIIGRSGAKLALNAVGGESATALAKVLADGGHHVTYGAMSKRPVTIPNGVLIFKAAHFHGFWLTKWIEATDLSIIRDDYQFLAERVAKKELRQPIDSVFTLQDYSSALTRAQASSRDGKVLFVMNGTTAN